jgi:hypothetical protein
MADEDLHAQDGGDSKEAFLKPSLARELILTSLQGHVPHGSSAANSASTKPLKMSNEAAAAASELMRLFVVEARKRAAAAAECEAEASTASSTAESEKTQVLIGAHHIKELAAELLLEFS